jgi:hypothetical protein
LSQPVNPYAPPQAPTPAQPQGFPFAPRVLVVPFQSAKGKTQLVVVLTVLVIVMQLLLAGSSFLQIQLLQSAGPGGLDPALATANDARHQGIAMILVLTGLVSFIALLVWIYAVHRNLPALGAGRLEFTPGWSVGWFFIPIMNLFKPCQALIEIWTESDPQRLARPGLVAGEPKSAAVVGWWWGLRICAGIAGQVFGFYAAQNNTIEGLIAVSWIAIALTLVLDLPTDVCQILMVRGIQTSQEERHRLVEAGGATSEIGSGLNPWSGSPFSER